MPQRTVHLSKKDAETLQAYAREQDLTVEEVVQRLVGSIRRTDAEDIHPEVRVVSARFRDWCLRKLTPGKRMRSISFADTAHDGSRRSEGHPRCRTAS